VGPPSRAKATAEAMLATVSHERRGLRLPPAEEDGPRIRYAAGIQRQ
jgi:hypothetical protein